MKIKLAASITVLTAFFLTSPVLEAADKKASEKVLESLENYFAAWAEADGTKRASLLESAWSDDGVYIDPTAHVAGRDALVEHIGSFRGNEQFKGFTIDQVTEIDVHHNSFRFGWEMRNAAGMTVSPGIDYGEFDDEGRITKIVGFFGAMRDLTE